MQSNKEIIPKKLRKSLVRITIGGSLAMVFISGTTCPAFIEFFRAIGAREFYFGLLSGIPLLMMLMHFWGAVSSNSMKRRKPCFLFCLIAGRLMYLPLVLLPILFPSVKTELMLGILLVIMFISSMLVNFAVPIWFSWMADLIPHRILNRYWGGRQFWMYIAWVLCYLILSLIAYLSKAPITIVYPWIAAIAITAGVIDILLFIHVKEPPNLTTRHMSAFKLLLAPLRHAEYGSFVMFSCVWTAVVMLAAPFMQLFALQVLKIPLWQITLAWCMSGVGIAVAGMFWGKIADSHGHKPVLKVALFFKPFMVMFFILVTPEYFLITAPIVFFFDGIINAALMVASNGYMLKLAPRENRSAFIAAITGLSGLCSGLAAIGAGIFLRSLSDFSFTALGKTWGNFHLLFGIDFILRMGCIFLASSIKEPKSSTASHILQDIWGVWPFRLLRFHLDSHDHK